MSVLRRDFGVAATAAAVVLMSGLAACAPDREEVSPTSLPEMTGKSWKITESNSAIRDIPTVKDFMPLGVACVEKEDHSLAWPGDSKWRLK